MGIKERKDRQKENIRKKILSEALDLFVKEGFKKVTMRKIAEKVEYNAATIYLYFKNKNSILFSLHEEGFLKFFERQKEINSIKGPLERLREHANAYLKFALDMPEFYDLMFIMSAPLEGIKEKKEWAAGERSYNFLKANVKDCISAGYFKGSDVESLSLVMWSIVHGIASLVIKSRIAVIPEDLLKQIISNGLDYIITSCGKK